MHVAVDDHSRVAYVELLADERGATVSAFLGRAGRWFRQHGVRIRRVVRDKGSGYISAPLTSDVSATAAAASIPGCQWTEGNGPVGIGDDGVVKYTRAHLHGLESEVVVRSPHSPLGRPKTIEEMRRNRRLREGVKSESRRSG